MIRCAPALLGCAFGCTLGIGLAVTGMRPALGHRGVDVQIAELDGIIASASASAELYLRRAELHRIHRDWDAARADYEAALARAPELAAASFGLGRLSQESGRSGEALVHIDAFLRMHPEHAKGRILRARALAMLERYDEAAAEYARVASASQSGGLGPDHILEQARALVAAGRLESALRVLDAGLARLGQPVALQIYAIEVEQRRGHHDAALARTDQLPDARYNRPRWLARRGDISAAAGRSEDARAAYAQALAELDAWPVRRRQTRAARQLYARLTAEITVLESPLGKIPTPARPWISLLECAQMWFTLWFLPGG